MRDHLHNVATIFRNSLSRRDLRHVEIASGLFTGSEWATWLAFLVYAYHHGGTAAASTISLVPLVVSALASPFLGAVASRHRTGQVLLAGYCAQGLTMAASAVAIAAGGPFGLVLVIAVLVNLAVTVIRPPLAHLLPTLVSTPDELTAANAMSGWLAGAGRVLAPVLVGVLINRQGPALALVATAAISLVAAALMIGIAGPAPHGKESSPVRQLKGNLKAATKEPASRTLLVLYLYYFAVVGAIDLLCVVLAVGVLHMSAGGTGFLNAAIGVGVILAGGVTSLIVGRRHLSGFMVSGLLGGVFVLAALGLHATVMLAFVALAMAGIGGSVFEVTMQTLLQRTVASDAISGVFSIVETLMNIGLASGVLLVRVGSAVDGNRGALVAPAAIGVILVLVLFRRIRRIDSSARVPVVQIRLLQRIDLFHGLGAPELEGLAQRLEPVELPEGLPVVTQGDPGDLYYAVAQGTLEVKRDGAVVNHLVEGDGFGEIALVHDVPRTATVTTTSPVLLYSLDQESFILIVTGQPAVRRATDAKIQSYGFDPDRGAEDGSGEISNPWPGDPE
jgi:MFS family permease